MPPPGEEALQQATPAPSVRDPLYLSGLAWRDGFSEMPRVNNRDKVGHAFEVESNPSRDDLDNTISWQS
jgi:hypothetical protein